MQHLPIDLLRAGAGRDVFDVRQPFGAGELWAQTGGRAEEKEEEKEGGGGRGGDAGECWWNAAAGVSEGVDGRGVFFARRFGMVAMLWVRVLPGKGFRAYMHVFKAMEGISSRKR